MEEIEHAQNTERGDWRYRSWADTQGTFQWSGDDLRRLSRGRGGGEGEGWGEGGGGGRGNSEGVWGLLDLSVLWLSWHVLI